MKWHIHLWGLPQGHVPPRQSDDGCWGRCWWPQEGYPQCVCTAKPCTSSKETQLPESLSDSKLWQRERLLTWCSNGGFHNKIPGHKAMYKKKIMFFYLLYPPTPTVPLTPTYNLQTNSLWKRSSRSREAERSLLTCSVSWQFEIRRATSLRRAIVWEAMFLQHKGKLTTGYRPEVSSN